MTLFVRAGGAALGLTLFAAGCSGGSEGADPPRAPGTSSAAPAVNGVRPGAEPASSLDGTWRARTGGGRVALHLFRGAAALNEPRFCSGTVDASRRIRLTCADGDSSRATGRATLAPDGRTLTVAWTGGPTDVLRRD